MPIKTPKDVLEKIRRQLAKTKQKCTFHYARERTGISLDHPFKKSRFRKKRIKAPCGYMWAIVDGEKILEHRHVMAQEDKIAWCFEFLRQHGRLPK